MSWLDYLARKAAGATGKAIDTVMSPFSPNTSFGGNPLIDLSSTLQNWGGNPGSTLKSAIVRPAHASDGFGIPETPIDDGGTTRIDDGLNEKVTWTGSDTQYGGDGGGTGEVLGDKAGTGIDLDAVMRARRARNEGSIDSFLNSARGLKDEVLGMVNKKRGDWKNLFNEGDQNITQTFEGEKGNARRTFNDLTSIEGNRARALGLGGSATDYASSRRAEGLGRTLGDVNTNASNNRMENKRTLDTRNDQGDAWEQSALRDYGTAEGKAREAKNSLLDTEENNVLGWLGNILQNQLAFNATKKGIGESVDNPYAVDTSKLTNFLNPGLTGAGATDASGGGAVQEGNPVDISTLAQIMNPTKYKSSLFGRTA